MELSLSRFAGTGCSGLVLPLLFERLLTKYGHSITLRIWAGVLLVLTSPALSMMPPRLPPSAFRQNNSSGHHRRPFFALSNFLPRFGLLVTWHLPAILCPGSFSPPTSFHNRAVHLQPSHCLWTDWF
ncbi:hypothetical protein BDZ91DRAFT_122211 [Kalaharituber pfeilii]|nr:hypothetical protein BDZ91DRAFT_122211 [Kalaharituber pfeilii]